MPSTHILGLPRIGSKRQLKQALEKYWGGELSQAELRQVAAQCRVETWQMQVEQDLSFLTVGDFAWYDQVLEHSLQFGVIPERFQAGATNELDTLFRMARGRAPTGPDAQACEMTKWFDTNYHYIVPELAPKQSFKLNAEPLLAQIDEAQAYGKPLKPVVIGPLTYLWCAKAAASVDKLDYLAELLPCYSELLNQLAAKSIEWCQIDEPILCLDLPSSWYRAFEGVYHKLAQSRVKVLLATYFGAIEHNLSAIANLPLQGLHIDMVTAPEQLTHIADRLSQYQLLSCGIIDGRNIWRADLAAKLKLLQALEARLGSERLWVSTSCSLLHVPFDLEAETKLAPELKQHLAFAKQKLTEVTLLAKALSADTSAVAEQLTASEQAMAARRQSQAIHLEQVKAKVAAITPDMLQRRNRYSLRASAQRDSLKLPMLPTTTIGSFPQTKLIRQQRRQFRAGTLAQAEYIKKMQHAIDETIAEQEALGLDVFVHGEPERNDMVEYFAEFLEGFAFTEFGWVQSYGSRCVKPPIIFGDVSRRAPMTLDWINYAQSKTKKPVKGMLTGPVTIIAWSFVRDDQPVATTAMQIALALREEVADLEQQGTTIIQVDEPAFRESLPLRKANQATYLEWAVNAFRLASSGVQDSTQIHTHMCYSEFNEMIDTIASMDADVISIEASRSKMDLLEAFVNFDYPNEIGPGIYDIHSPQVPSVEEMTHLLEQAMGKISKERLWVNPDCGLKTRAWEETRIALQNMVQAAISCRQKYFAREDVA